MRIQKLAKIVKIKFNWIIQDEYQIWAGWLKTVAENLAGHK